METDVNSLIVPWITHSVVQEDLKVTNITESPLLPTNTDLSNYVLGEAMFSICASLISSILIFIFHSFVVRIDVHIMSVLKFLTIADFISLWGNLMVMIRYHQESMDKPYVTLEKDAYCDVASFVVSTFSMASFWWTFFFALHLYYIQMERSYKMESRKVLIWCNIIAWGLPLTISLFAVGFNAFGWAESTFSHSWCWINGKLDNQLEIAWILLAGRGWEFLAYLGTALIYLRSKIVLFKRSRRHYSSFSVREIEMSTEEDLHETSLIRNSRQFTSPINREDATENTSSVTNTSSDHTRPGNYSIILWVVYYLYLTRLWGMIRYGVIIYRLATDEEVAGFNSIDDHVLIHMQSVLNNAQATVNFLVFFVFDNTVRQKIVAYFSRTKSNISLASQYYSV